MASSKDFLEFVLEQLSMLDDIAYRAMMGEYVIYYRGKVVGGIYDNRLLVKPTESMLKIMPNAKMEIPYPGGKPMVMIPDIENPELLEKVFNTLYSELSNKGKTKWFQ
jgi:TfoX/Sxy family transcriptional regulator of competence genes